MWAESSSGVLRTCFGVPFAETVPRAHVPTISSAINEKVTNVKSPALPGTDSMPDFAADPGWYFCFSDSFCLFAFFTFSAAACGSLAIT